MLQLHGVTVKNPLQKIGFTLDKSSNTGTNSYVEENSLCVFPFWRDRKDDYTSETSDIPQSVFAFVTGSNDSITLEVSSRLMGNLKFYEKLGSLQSSATIDKNSANVTKTSSPDSVTSPAPDQPKKEQRSRREDDSADNSFTLTASLPVAVKEAEQGLIYSSSFLMSVDTDEESGYYELFFHNCHNHGRLSKKKNDPTILITMEMKIVEKNKDSYLSAGDLALPTMYAAVSLLFFVSGLYWFLMLCTTKDPVFKIHYLMGALMVVKSVSVFFHAIDYYFIGRDGLPEAWAVIFYIVHLLKGMLLFICLLLIGTGWAFIKYILSDREKKLFLIVIPLQVIANVAYIITQGSQEDSQLYSTWQDVMILVDLLCCGAILIPVIWSVRHLQEASQTDGKAAINLAKLKLFQHFYVMVICYLYFTRIIVYLLKITLPFQLIWLDEFFTEVGTFVFFVITGYKFRPGCNNPYLAIPQEVDEESHAITQSGLTETLTKVNQYEKNLELSDDEEEEDLLLPLQRHRSSFV